MIDEDNEQPTRAPIDPDGEPASDAILRLVAEGHTNREIGDRLFISEKTASVHVSNIIRKLGVSNRGEAAALAHREGLTA